MSVRVRPVSQQLNPTAASWPKVKKLQLKTNKPTSSGSTRLRPDTATLDKPLMLDPGLIRKLDMTRITRERLVTIENLVATPKKIKASRAKEKTIKISPRCKRNELKVTEDSWEDDSSVSEEPKLRKLSRALNKTFRIRSHVRKSLKEVLTPSPTLHVSGDAEIIRSNKSRSPVPREKAEFAGIEIVPAPCCTCGRKEQPERLHAHPKRTLVKKNKKDDQENKEVQKNTVSKPLPIKFRSGKTRPKVVEQPPTPEPEKKEVSLVRRETFKVERSNRRHLPVVCKKESPAPVSPTRLTATKVRRSPVPSSPEKKVPQEVPASKELDVVPVPKNPVVHSASSRRPRTIVCYLCSKQFFTTSFPLHESHCLQKWQRENAELPAHLQMPLPQKPEVPLTSDEWNQYAWEAAQAVLVPCENCNRTFLPSRLEAHLRACRQAHPAKKSCAKRQVQDWDSDREDRSEPISGPPTVHCHICGRMFTKASINIHEEHCLKRWQKENQSSEDSKKSPETSSMSSAQSSAQSTPRRRFVICYICGRQFGSKSIDIHEPQCLKKWHAENDKLPPHQRRQEPQKPDIIYDIETGKIDIAASSEAQWQSHLVQLIPCGKCGRTFNPDRVAVHERCCKGLINKN